MKCFRCGGELQPIDEIRKVCMGCGTVTPSIWKKVHDNSNVLNTPDYDDFPTMFENLLVAAVKANHLRAVRSNKDNKYNIDLEIRKTETDEVVFYAEAEYDSSCRMFTKDGNISYSQINILARKMYHFTTDKERPVVFVKGNVKRTIPICLVLAGNHIKQFAKGPIKMKCKIGSVVTDDYVYRVKKDYAFEKGQICVVPLSKWLECVKRIYYLDSVINEVL